MERKVNNRSDGIQQTAATRPVKITQLPKQFHKSLFDGWDQRFLLILLASFIVHFSTAFYFALHPPTVDVSASDIKRIQEQYASLVLKQDIVEEPEVIESVETPITDELQGSEEKAAKEDIGEKDAAKENVKKGPEETKVATAEGRKEKRTAGVAERKRTREQISKEVSSKGLLGLLSGSGSAASGESVVDVLRDVESTSGNLDDVIGQIDGLKKAGAGDTPGARGNRSVKGNRVTSGGGIDDLITDRGSAKSSDVGRGGDLVVSSISSVESADGVHTDSRDSDEISMVVNKHNAAIQTCYTRELKRNPDLKGKVVVRFTIEPSGKVSKVDVVSTTLNNPRVERCILSKIRRWDDFGPIDASLGSATVRQVYTFGY
ncbi:TonB family protein [candidate division KSB1 bacterium]|nr:TonB family protein [candidate division KSB1 bacterium]